MHPNLRSGTPRIDLHSTKFWGRRRCGVPTFTIFALAVALHSSPLYNLMCAMPGRMGECIRLGGQHIGKQILKQVGFVPKKTSECKCLSISGQPVGIVYNKCTYINIRLGRPVACPCFASCKQADCCISPFHEGYTNTYAAISPQHATLWMISGKIHTRLFIF